MDNLPSSSARPAEKRRRRPPLACIACRRRKVRCDRKLPCQNCVRARRATSCAYVPDERVESSSSRDDGAPGYPDGLGGNVPQQQQQQQQHNHLVNPAPYLSPTASHNCSPSATPEQLAERVRQLEQQLSQVLDARNGRRAAPPPEVPSADPPPRFLGPDHWQVGSLGTIGNGIQAQKPCTKPSENTEKDISSAVNANAILSKSRYLGNSHWIHGVTLFPRLMSFLQSLESDKTSEAYQTVAASKALGRQIKAARIPRVITPDFGKHIPSRELADELLEAYFRTFETVYRILHVPSFRLEYSRYWQNPKGAREAFVIQLQLCMALGAVLHDDTYSLRSLAARWVYEARLWLLQPSEKSRLNLSGLQAWCLIHLSRDVCGIGGDLVWAYAGTMMRMALYIGLHRDPSHLPKMSLLAAETRRRVWATILEILVQSSMDSGGPPLISPQDYDTKPPGNYNDEDLQDTTSAEAPPLKPIATFTGTSMQITLLKCIKTRLDIAAYLNEFRSVTSYDKSLLLNSALTTVSRSLDALVRVYQSQQPGPSTFQLRIIEYTIQRYFLALHLPWLGSARDDPRYYFSRKLCVEIGLRYHKEAKEHGYVGAVDGAFKAPDDFGRLLICGSGGFRYIATQCLITATLELLWELEERMEGNRSLGLEGTPGFASTPAGATLSTASTPGMSVGLILGSPGQDVEMLDILRHSATWMRARIKAGEVNIKGYLFKRAMLTEAEGLARGASDEELNHNLKEGLVEASKDVLSLLKEMYDALGRGGSVTGASDLNGRSRTLRYTGMNGVPVSIDDAEDEAPTMDTGSSGDMSNDWDWNILQDPGFNLNFNLSLGGMDLVFGTPSMY